MPLNNSTSIKLEMKSHKEKELLLMGVVTVDIDFTLLPNIP
jgi:hypothetical protein